MVNMTTSKTVRSIRLEIMRGLCPSHDHPKSKWRLNDDVQECGETHVSRDLYCKSRQSVHAVVHDSCGVYLRTVTLSCPGVSHHRTLAAEDDGHATRSLYKNTTFNGTVVAHEAVSDNI